MKNPRAYASGELQVPHADTLDRPVYGTDGPRWPENISETHPIVAMHFFGIGADTPELEAA
jgi:hypothetical protein